MNNVRLLRTKGTNAARAEALLEKQTRIYLLGTMRALGPGGEDVLPRAKKTQAVLAYLCLARGERVPRGRIAGVIWDRSGEAQARDSLRHALGEFDRMGNWRIDTDHETVRLNTTACWIDAFEAPDRSDLLLDSLYGISSAFDQWLIGERVRFETHWQTALENELNDVVTRKAAPELRAAAARKLLNFVPTHEPAVRKLMAAFADMDDRAQAIREYERFRAVLSSNLGISPSEKTMALHEAIRLEWRARAKRASQRSPQSAHSIGGTTSAEADFPAQAATGVAPGRDVQPSIAVLPFRNLSGEPGHSLLAEGLAEDIVEAVSRVPSLFVVSRLSAAAFENSDRPPLEMGDALGVRYILAGSIRMKGDRLRLVVELTETDTGKVLWISRFDRKFSDLLDLQSGLAEAVIGSIAPHLRFAELKRVRIKRPEDWHAYDLFLRAQENMHSPSRAVFESSERLFELAIAREPHYAAALAWRAYWHVMRVGQGWSPDPRADKAQADHFANLAVESDASEPMALAVQGHVATYLHMDFDRAFSCFDSALQINPNGPRAWLWSANAHAYIGEGAHAVEKINRAIALSPYDPLVHAYSGGASLAYLADSQYARAIEFALRSIRENPSYSSAYKLLIAALALAGRETEARSPVRRLLLLEPGFTVDQHRHRFPGRGTPFADLYCEALAAAGVPLSD